MRRLLLVISSLMVALTVLMIGGRAVGSQNKPPALARFQADQCAPQPCWRGIRPGQTTMRQAETILRADTRLVPSGVGQWCWRTEFTESGVCWNVSLYRWSSDQEGPIGTIVLHPSTGDFKLGDALSLFGDPLTSNLCWVAGARDGDVPDTIARPLAVAYLTFRGNIKIVAYNPKRPQARQLDPYMTVVTIYYQAGYDIYTPRWEGFTKPLRWGCSRG